MKPLTEKQRVVLAFVEDFCRRQGYPPTVREVAAHLGVQPRAAADHLTALKRKGYLHREPGLSRGLSLASRLEEQTVEVPILGRIAAGQPLLAAEQVEDTLALPRTWVQGEEVFLLRVSGDSMAPLLLPGDLVMVRVQPRVARGERKGTIRSSRLCASRRGKPRNWCRSWVRWWASTAPWKVAGWGETMSRREKIDVGKGARGRGPLPHPTPPPPTP
ncbi:MAG: transcriptional repressor LexA [Syntrophobacterales bacterium]